MSTPIKNAPNLNSEESWSAARRYASLMFPIPPTIVQAIQLLWADHLEGQELGKTRIRLTTINALRIIEKSAKLKLPIYFSAVTLFPDKVATIKEDDTIKALVEILEPGLFASFLALLYLHRRLKKICTDPQWETLSKEYVLNMELGYLVGSSVPKLGTAEGTLAGGIRYAALAPFLIATPEHYMKFRNLKKRQFDLLHEHSIWGCDHTQIGAFVLKELGFSLDLRRNSHALRKFPDDELCTLDGPLKSWRAALGFIDGIKKNADLTETSHELALESFEVMSLKSKTAALFQGRTSFGWMFKGPPTDDGAE